jgi:hypothetical protein
MQLRLAPLDVRLDRPISKRVCQTVKPPCFEVCSIASYYTCLQLHNDDIDMLFWCCYDYCVQTLFLDSSLPTHIPLRSPLSLSVYQSVTQRQGSESKWIDVKEELIVNSSGHPINR